MKRAVLPAVLSLSFVLSAQSPRIPDYRNQKEARKSFSEVCEDKSVTSHFLQNSSADYYMVYETITDSSDTFIKVVRIAGKSKIAGVNYYVKSGEDIKNLDEQKWLVWLREEAPEYVSYMQGKGKKCKIVHED